MKYKNMKTNHLIFTVCVLCFFISCKKFELDAPYKEVTVVYGVLDANLDTNYVKIYKGFQGGNLHAQNPDSIYYYDKIRVVLKEYDLDNIRTSRPDILLSYTHDFPRDAGEFYYDKERIIYFTDEPLNKNNQYKIVVTNKATRKIMAEGMTRMVGDFGIANLSTYFILYGEYNSVTFTRAPHAHSYEIHVNFLYFEVDKSSKKVVKQGKVKKNITPQLEEEFTANVHGLFKRFLNTLLDNIAGQLDVDNTVDRFVGFPGSNGVCIEIEAWAAEKSFIKFLLSNQPSSSFIQVQNRYTNLSAEDDALVFGFLSSRTKAPIERLGIDTRSEDSIVRGSKTRHLGFKKWSEYIP